MDFDMDDMEDREAVRDLVVKDVFSWVCASYAPDRVIRELMVEFR